MTTDIHNKGSLFLIISVILSAIGQLFMRAGMSDLRKLLDIGNTDILAVLGHPGIVSISTWTIAGLFAYISSLGCWMIALKKHELSFAYPMLSISYILVYAGAVFWPRLGESTSTGKTLGIIAIVIGVILITQSQQKSHSPDQQGQGGK